MQRCFLLYVRPTPDSTSSSLIIAVLILYVLSKVKAEIWEHSDNTTDHTNIKHCAWINDINDCEQTIINPLLHSKITCSVQCCYYQRNDSSNLK